MLFGPQYDDDVNERPEGTSTTGPPSRRKKTSKVKHTRDTGGSKPASRSKRQNTNGVMSSPTSKTSNGFNANGTAQHNSSATAKPRRHEANRRTNITSSRKKHVASVEPLPPTNKETMYETVWKHLKFRKHVIKLAWAGSEKPICVTGVDGFLASWIACELLTAGYRVRGTVQNRKDDVSGLTSLPQAHNFTVVETSLLTPEACDLAVQGCEFVIHTGTPSSCSVRDPLSEQQEPGVHSIGSRMHCIIPMMTNFIQACARAHIKRVVLTSSIAAMADSVSPTSIINDACWNTTSTLERNPHFLSLKLAEEAAWQLVDQLPKDRKVDLVTINAGTLFGPALSKSKLSQGNQIIFDLVTGQFSALVDLNWSMVDVRDCARAHILALENSEAKGRYVCVHKSVWMKEIVETLASNGYSGRDLPWKVGLPNWVARLPAYSLQLGQVGCSLYARDPTYPRASPYLNDKVVDQLNLLFRDVRETIVETANDLLKWGYIKPWAEDHETSACTCCGNTFTFYRRKHHCRECGEIICGVCSMSRAVVEGTEGKARLCDRCVKNSVPGLVTMLKEDDPDNKRKAVVALESLMENASNHDYVTRFDGIRFLLEALHLHDETTAEHAAGALFALSTSVSSSLQMVLEGAVLQMLEVEETTRTWALCLQALRNIWKQINRDDFRRMLHAVSRVSSEGSMRGNVLLTFVHMMDPREMPSLLPEGLVTVLYQMLQSPDDFSRCAAAHAIKHLVPVDYDPDLTIEVPPFDVDNHEELFLNSSLSDLQFLVKGHIQPINAHKVVLFFRNSYFKNMVRFGSASSQKAMIEIDNCSYEVFSILLRFLYTGEVDITPDVAEELLRAASFYCVYELQKRAEAFLSSQIDVANVVDLLSLAEECHAVDLKKNCVPFLMKHIHDVVRLPAYEEHRVRSTEEVLKALAGMLGPEWEASLSALKQEMEGSPVESLAGDDVKAPSSLPRSGAPRAVEVDEEGNYVLSPKFLLSPVAPRSTDSRQHSFVESPRMRGVEDPSYLPQLSPNASFFQRPRNVSNDFSEGISEAWRTYSRTLVNFQVLFRSVTVEKLREELFQVSSVAPRDQILLGGPPFSRLDPRRTISTYDVTSENKQVFLYDKRMLSQENPTPPETQLAPTRVQPAEAPVQSSEGSKQLSESSSPLLRALADYESHFQVQVRQSQALEQSTHANMEACAQAAKELEVQSQAIDAAISNLEIFKVSMTKHFRPFWDDFTTAQDHHKHLLSNFDTYLEALATVELHPSLATSEKKTLYDCIPVDREREWATQCQKSQEHVLEQVEKLKSMHESVEKQVTELVEAQNSVSGHCSGASKALEEMKEHAKVQAEITAKLNANLEYVMHKISETSSTLSQSNAMHASSNALEVCRNIDELYREQHDLVPTSESHAEEVIKRLERVAQVKNSFFSTVHSSMRQVSSSQSQIRDFESSLTMLKEALAAQKRHFGELEHLEKLPDAYEACLEEIVRRRRYGVMFSNRIQTMAEELAQLRQREVQARESFLQSYGQHLPREFVPGLAEKPSHCEFRMRPFDQDLPDVGDVELEDKADGSDVDAQALAKRCKELEAKVAELESQVRASDKKDVSESVGSDASKAGDSSCEFPLVLALAGEMSHASDGSEGEHKLDANGSSRRDQEMAKLVRENQEYLLNAAAFEGEMKESMRREKNLQEAQANLQQSVQSLQISVGVHKSSLVKVLDLLELQVEGDVDEYLKYHMSDVEERIQTLVTSKDRERQLEQELEEQEQKVHELSTSDESFKISFRSFDVNDLALFLPTSAPGSDAQRVYLAFHLDCPHRFLSQESITSFSTSLSNGRTRYPDYVVGRIVFIDEQVATESNNPYALPLETTFYTLTVASLHET